MRRKASLYLSVAAIGGAVLLSAPSMQLRAQQGAPAGVSIGDSDLGGVVSGPSGPEAGVWVIAETTDLPTKFAKIVVTDDQGRYVLPELPKANYSVWVRGYGLVDSPKVATAPGKILNLTAVPAPSAAAAAEYYPAIYWYSMLKVPDKSEFPGTGPQGNGMPTNIRSQAQWLDVVKTNGCYTCHQLGNKATRTIPKEFADMKPEEAWARRIMSGQAQVQMANAMGRLDVPRALKLFADWTDRIAAGELPAAKPTRPQGAERNIVISVWDWSDPKAYLHDEISTDKRKPTVNAYGKIYGSTEDSTDFFPVLDPKAHAATAVKMPVRDPKTPTSKNNGMAPSPYWGEEVIWDSQASMHNPMMDEKGQVWFTSRVGQFANPDFCRKGSDHPSAKLTPIEQSTRHLSMYDPKTGKITLIRTCFPTHHLVFAEDADNTLWTSAGGPQSGVIGWLNRKMFEETGDEAKSQGWSAIVLDTNGNGKRDEDYVEPNQPVDPAKDKRITGALYGIGINPVDNTVWGSVLTFPGYVIRVNPGANPPATTLAEDLRATAAGLRAARHGHRPQRRCLGAAVERAYGEFRSAQVHGTAQRPGRHRQALPRGVDALSVPRSAIAERERARLSRGELLHLGRPVQHLRTGRERADGDRQRQRVAARAGQRAVGQSARPLSDGLLRQVDGRPHRRPERRLEGPRAVVDVRQPHAVPRRGRQGHAAQGRTLPVAARSAGAVTAGRGKAR